MGLLRLTHPTQAGGVAGNLHTPAPLKRGIGEVPSWEGIYGVGLFIA